VIDGPLLARQRMRHPPIAIAGKVQLPAQSRRADPARVWPAPQAWGAHNANCGSRRASAQMAPRQRGQLVLKQSDHGMLLPDGVSVLREACCKAFLNAACSSTSCPQKRSKSTIRVSSGVALAAAVVPARGVKAASPRSAYSCRQRARRLSAKWCSWHICAGRFVPLASWRTIFGLNSRVKVRPGMAHLAFCLRSLTSVYRRLTTELSCLPGLESGFHSITLIIPISEADGSLTLCSENLSHVCRALRDGQLGSATIEIDATIRCPSVHLSTCPLRARHSCLGSQSGHGKWYRVASDPIVDIQDHSRTASTYSTSPTWFPNRKPIATVITVAMSMARVARVLSSLHGL